MIAHISPLYIVAQVCAVACIITLLAGLVITDWEMVLLRWKSKQSARRREERPEWADEERWEQSKRANEMKRFVRA